MAKILVVEDDLTLAEVIQACLRADRHEAQHVLDGEQALEYLQAYHFDLVILDWELPKVTGIEVCAHIKSSGKQTPVLMLTGKATIDEKEQAFESGADDYLTKPFHKTELTSRIKALTRRPVPIGEGELTFKELSASLSAAEAKCGSKILDLRTKELDLLAVFMKHPEQILSVTTIHNLGWTQSGESGTLAWHISSLRSKLKIAESSVTIEKIGNDGYVLREPEQTPVQDAAPDSR